MNRVRNTNLRTAEINKQEMYYSLFKGEEPDYIYDDDGNKVVAYYDDEDNPYYEEAGTSTAVYDKPIFFRASISSNLNEMHARAFGVDQSSVYSVISCVKGYLPLNYGAKIWKDSKIAWKDEEKTIPDHKSADYTVVGINTEYIRTDWFLLRRNS